MEESIIHDNYKLIPHPNFSKLILSVSSLSHTVGVSISDPSNSLAQISPHDLLNWNFLVSTTFHQKTFSPRLLSSLCQSKTFPIYPIIFTPSYHNLKTLSMCPSEINHFIRVSLRDLSVQLAKISSDHKLLRSFDFKFDWTKLSESPASFLDFLDKTTNIHLNSQFHLKKQGVTSSVSVGFPITRFSIQLFQKVNFKIGAQFTPVPFFAPLFKIDSVLSELLIPLSIWGDKWKINSKFWITQEEKIFSFGSKYHFRHATVGFNINTLFESNVFTDIHLKYGNKLKIGVGFDDHFENILTPKFQFSCNLKLPEK